MSSISKAHDKKAQIMAFLQDDLDTKGSLKNSALEMLKTGAVGVIGAGAGAALGKPSLLIGLAVITAGHYYKSNKIIAVGTGMLASSAYKAVSGVSGTGTDGLDGAKERLKAFGQDLKERLYLDKIKSLISKKGSSNSGTDGLGEVSYFNPNNGLDMGGLDAIEQEIRHHAERFERKQFAGSEDDLTEGEEDLMGSGDDIIY